ncbi:MAG: hypothetical protein AAFX53_06740 [Bacteroidota bacterium]
MENGKTEKKDICKSLRARNPYGMMEGGENPWLLLDDANTICWCISSGGAIGPDDGLVSPKYCLSSRSCFVPGSVNEENDEGPVA